MYSGHRNNKKQMQLCKDLRVLFSSAGRVQCLRVLFSRAQILFYSAPACLLLPSSNVALRKISKEAVVVDDTSCTELALGSCKAGTDMKAPEDETPCMGQNELASSKRS